MKTSTGPRPPPSYLIAILLAATVCRYLFVHAAAKHEFTLHSFALDDEPIYGNAISDWLAGLDPYRTIHGVLRFVYPPIFLYIGGFLARIIPGGIGWVLYAAIHVGSTIALPIVLARFYFRQTWLNTGFALLVFFAEPRLTGVLAVMSGNIASVLYLTVFLAMLPGLRANRWTWFYVAVFIGALVKFPLLLFLLLPLLAGVRQWRYCAICTGAVTIAYALQRVFLPQLYSGYEWSLVQQVRVIHHYGYGVMGLAAGLDFKLHKDVSMVPFVVACVFAVALIATLFTLRPRIEAPRTNRLWLSLILLSIILASPRVLGYDADIALLAAFVIFVNALHIRRLLSLLVVLFLPSLIVPHFVNAQTLVGCYETLLLILAFAAGALTLWRESAAPAEPVASEAFTAASI